MKIEIKLSDIKGMLKYASVEGYNLPKFMSALRNPIEFNNGACTSFAYHFGEKIKSSTICDSTELYDDIKRFIPAYEYGNHYHCFLFINGKYYDFESLTGVNKLNEMPFFKRLKNSL